MTTAEQQQAAARQYTQENGRDRGIMKYSQKGVIWSEHDDHNGMGKIDTSPTGALLGRYKSDGMNSTLNTTAGGKPPRADPK